MTSSELLFKFLKQKTPDLILLDIDMPNLNGFQTIKLLKLNPETQEIPVIFVSGRSDEASVTEAMQLGAADFLTKPFPTRLLQKRVALHLDGQRLNRRLKIQNKLVTQAESELIAYRDDFQTLVDNKARAILEQQKAVFEIVAKLIECRRDGVFGEDCRKERFLSLFIDALNERNLYQDEMAGWDAEQIVLASRLHDIGKLAVADQFLAKPGKLTQSEFEEVKKYTTRGGDIIEAMETQSRGHELLKFAKIFAETHKEKWDGSGYPHGLAGAAIPLPGRLMALDDVYAALTAVRIYKTPLSHEEAVQVILEGRGTHFDPLLVDVFAQEADKFKSLLAA
jgi:putative two-component system response regulator